MNCNFKKGDIVLAKIGGFPWWPAMVAGVRFEREPRILVNFIGDRSHAELPIHKIDSYKENSPELSSVKNRSLYRSIKIANKILKGEITYELHFQLMKDNKYSIDFSDSNVSFSDDSSRKSIKILKEEKTKKINKIKDSTDANMVGKSKSKDKCKDITVNLTADKTTNDDSLIISSGLITKKMNSQITQMVNDFYFNKINLPSSAQEKATIESLALATKELSEKSLNEEIYLLINSLVEILHYYVGHKNIEISSKSSEILVMIQQKILTDLFEKTIPFSDSSVAISEFSISKQKVKEFLKIENKRWLGKKTERMKARLFGRFYEKPNRLDIQQKAIASINLVSDSQEQLNENKSSSVNQIDLAIKTELPAFIAKKTFSIPIESKEELRLEYIDKKVYAICLNNSQLYNLFSETFLFEDPTNFNESTLNQAVNDYYQAMTKSSQNRFYFPDEKKFFLRKGVCIQLKKVIKKILPDITDENAIKLTKIIEHKAAKIDPNINECYKNIINNFFNKIKLECLKI